MTDLFAATPLAGTAEGQGFWKRSGDAGGSAALFMDPDNMGGPFFDRVHVGGEGGIASRVRNFLGELMPAQRTVVAEAIGSVIDCGTIGISGRYGGELWLRGAEMSAWRVAPTSRRKADVRNVHSGSHGGSPNGIEKQGRAFGRGESCGCRHAADHCSGTWAPAARSSGAVVFTMDSGRCRHSSRASNSGG
ncbi:hypothetical protein ACFWVU_00035 [Streptomyces sp. NPDC058686]|uniref:hypothetical protein n=1 Tax=Streptomyces sp. NPDC058686 TaxID=3346599 RepID=UPI0036676817